MFKYNRIDNMVNTYNDNTIIYKYSYSDDNDNYEQYTNILGHILSLERARISEATQRRNSESQRRIDEDTQRRNSEDFRNNVANVQIKNNNRNRNKKQEDITEMRESSEKCSVCLDTNSNCMIIPCAHKCICSECSIKLRKTSNDSCPICRERIKQIVKLN